MTTWTNFAGDQRCRPRAFERPATHDELRRVIADAARRGETVRVAGAGHSFNDSVLTRGTLISLDRMARVIDVDREARLVRVEAGATLGALCEAMDVHGLAFPNMGDINVQSIAGATATGTHGTGLAFSNLSSCLNSIELTLASGDVVEVSEESDREAWLAARVSLGALGIVSAVTIRAAPAFRLRAVETTAPLDHTLTNLDALNSRHDHFGFFTFPHSPLAMTKTWERTDAPARPASAPSEWIHDELLTNYAYWAVCRLGRARRSWIPALNRISAAASGTTRYTDRSDRVYATPRRVPITEMEYAIPIGRAAEAVRAVRAIAEQHRHDVPCPLEVRFSAGDDALLAPSGGRETCWIAVHQFERIPWEPYFREVDELLTHEYDGRPHWGKRHFRTAADLQPHYPGWGTFQAVRARLDPAGTFTNAHVERVLGAVA
ncbi:MAG: D-arabinono-1,4-lactone oxidase [Baekduia sp.]